MKKLFSAMVLLILFFIFESCSNAVSAEKKLQHQIQIMFASHAAEIVIQQCTKNQALAVVV